MMFERVRINVDYILKCLAIFTVGIGIGIGGSGASFVGLCAGAAGALLLLDQVRNGWMVSATIRLRTWQSNRLWKTAIPLLSEAVKAPRVNQFTLLSPTVLNSPHRTYRRRFISFKAWLRSSPFEKKVWAFVLSHDAIRQGLGLSVTPIESNGRIDRDAFSASHGEIIGAQRILEESRALDEERVVRLGLLLFVWGFSLQIAGALLPLFYR